jgi:anti-anti-sigma regulatory factor
VLGFYFFLEINRFRFESRLQCRGFFMRPQTIRLRLDGTVSVESVAELDKACARFRDRHLKMIILDMAGVDFMKDDAARKLVELQSDSLRIINCSPFIVTLLETLRKD